MANIPRIVVENPQPGIGDGRNFDPARAYEHGEGALIEIGDPDRAWPIPADAHPHPGRAPSETYYDLPVVKAAPWTAAVPAYFHLGGLAGAAASLAGAVQLFGTARHAALERKLHLISLVGEAIGGVCLIADLGRPARFHHMLRVFRPTSPMNMGTWILSTASTASALSVLDGFVRSPRAPRPTVAGIGGAIAGTLLSTYTGVLVGNTTTPIWSATRRQLPMWFAALSASSLASMLELLGSSTRPEARAVRVYGVVAKTAALATQIGVERAATADGVDAPLRAGTSGQLWRWARWLTAGSLVATLLPTSRKTVLLAGALGTAAAVMSRFAITKAGPTSAADPRATFEPQRRAMTRG
jgi:formate-dependent nitrite reductase membrane component NrfD